MPESLRLVKAKVLRLRITVPADIYNSGIVVEVDGVISQIEVLKQRSEGRSRDAKPQKGDRSKHELKQVGKRPASPPLRGIESRRAPQLPDSEEDEDDYIPTTQDLAKSFLNVEPQEEKEELEAAINAQSQRLSESSLSTAESTIEHDVGTGTDLSLPGFLAGFLKGIRDRLVIRIQDVEFRVDLELPSAGKLGDSPTEPTPLSISLRVKHFSVEGITTDGVEHTPEKSRPGLVGPSPAPRSQAGKRRVCLEDVCAYLITKTPFFERVAKVSRSPSLTSRPNKTSILRSESDSTVGSFPKQSSRKASTSDGPFPQDSPVFGQLVGPEAAETRLTASVITADDDRFADPMDDEELHTPIGVSPTHSGIPSSRTVDELVRETILDEPHMEESQMNNSGNSYIYHDRFRPQNSARANSALGTDAYVNSRHLYQSSSSILETPGFLDTSEFMSFGEQNTNHVPENDNGRRPRADLVRSSPTLDTGVLHKHLHGDLPPDLRLSLESLAPTSKDKIDAAAVPVDEDMSESKIYSHEEAESIYMSAMTAASAQSAQRLHLPGGWGSYSESGDEQFSDADSFTKSTTVYPTRTSIEALEPEQYLTSNPQAVSAKHGSQRSSTSSNERDHEDRLYDESQATSGLLSEEAVPPTHAAKMDDTAAKQFLAIDKISFYIPDLDETQSSNDQAPEKIQVPKQSSDHWGTGTFMEYIEDSNLRPRKSSTIHRPSQAPSTPVPDEKNPKDELGVCVSNIELTGDVSTIQLLVETALLVSSTMKPSPPSAQEKNKEVVARPSAALRVKLSVENISVFFVERLQTLSQSTIRQAGAQFTSLQQNDSFSVLFRCCLRRLQSSIEIGPQSTTLEAGISDLSFGYSNEDILSFDESARLRTSIRDLREPQLDAISLFFSNSNGITTLKTGTLPIKINFDLQKLDDAMISFGGVSGVLELGSSIMSNSTMMADPPSPKRARGVHFESPPPKVLPETAHTTKLNIRLGGAFITIRGRNSGVILQSSAVKILLRPKQGLIGLSVDEIRLAGPHFFNEDETPPALVQLTNTRLECLSTPKDDDLERLLSLLTPSRDRYEHDDDILIETLLRQRRKGPVVRIRVAKAQAEVNNLASLDALSRFGDELAKLSTVTKYLPEDDRPGILTLCAIEELDVRVNVNDLIGTLTVNAQSSQVAHVGLPSLLAIEVGTLQAHRGHGEKLIHSVLELSSSERIPMIMARYLGGEIEPTVKVKLFNLCLEYRVPTIMAILGLKDGVTVEDVASELAASVATITDNAPKNLSPQTSKSSDHLRQPSKSLRLDVLLRDCALGLNPRNMPSKVLVVLTDTKLLSNIPGKENLKSAIEIRKASILMTDQEDRKVVPNEHVSKRRGSAGLGSRQIAELCKKGYVSISYISAAHADLRLLDNSDGSQTADVELRDDLFVLETCADSTQTLFATLNDLKPPAPPSRDTKYRTEVMPVEEMMASFTGDAFAHVRNQTEDSDEFLGLQEEDVLDDTDLTADTDSVESFDNPSLPISEEEFEADILDENIKQIASPRLSSGTDSPPLLESFQEKYEVDTSEAPLAFEENYFGTGSEVKGHARKWNSMKNQHGTTNEFKARGSPLKVRARDVHVIWNLFDGYDWQSTRDTITKTVKDVEQRAEERRSRGRRSTNTEEDDEESVIGDFLFNSIYIGIPANRDPKDLTRQINRNVDDLMTETESLATGTTTTLTAASQSPSRGHPTLGRGKRLKVHRSKQHKVTFELKSVSVDMVVFPPSFGETQSSIEIRVKEFEIFDHVPTSTWKKFATYLHDAGEPELGKPMIRIEMLTVKPVAELAASEIVLKVRLKHTRAIATQQSVPR